MRAYALRCEYLANPVGVDVDRPRLSWKCADGQEQTAWQIRAAHSPEALEQGVLCWDSGEVPSGESLHWEYPQPLHTREIVYWQVQLKDETGSCGPWSEIASFEMGLLTDADKCAQWIDPEQEYDPESQPPVSLLRREFDVKPDLISARLYVSALGIYEASLNGKRVGEQVLTPGFTAMKTRRQYQTYDVTDLLQEGANAMGAALADGWVRGRLGFGGRRNGFGERLALWAQLVLCYADGEEIALVTDDQWKTTKNGPYRMSDMRDGEIYDARMELPGWNCAGYDDQDWLPVITVDYDGILVGTQSAPVLEVERITGKLLPTPDGRTVIDFGQNLAGYVEFRVSGPAGHTVKLTHGEVLNKAGNFSMINFGQDRPPFLKALRQEVFYTLSGNGVEVYKPSFITMGFRYILIENWPGEVDPRDFTAIVVTTAVERTGDFHCSNEILNQFFRNVIWSQKGNFVDIPTDCPHRERMGWTGDAQIFFRASATNYNAAPFYTKWMRDVQASQLENGAVPNTVPSDMGRLMPDGSMNPRVTSSGWGDAITIIPYHFYELYGDLRLLEELYPNMKRWVDYETAAAASTHNNPDNPYDQYIWDSVFHWGEWLEPRLSEEQHREEQDQPKPESATAYLAYSARLLSEMASLLGRTEDEAHYKTLFENVRDAYLYTFTDDGDIDTGYRQCLYVRPLALDLLPEDKRQHIADKLNAMLEKYDYHVGTGFLSTPFLCEVLLRYGYLETAYKALQQTTPPSWLYSVTRGATTMWESWNGYNDDGEPMASHNHYAFGAIVDWMYRRMVGIDSDRAHPAYRRFWLAPMPGGGITEASATIDTLRGEIKCAWEINDGTFCMKFTVPSNTTADVVLPAQVHNVSSSLSFAEKDGHLTAVAFPGSYELKGTWN